MALVTYRAVLLIEIDAETIGNATSFASFAASAAEDSYDGIEVVKVTILPPDEAAHRDGAESCPPPH